MVNEEKEKLGDLDSSNNLMPNHSEKVNKTWTKVEHDFCCLCFSRKSFVLIFNFNLREVSRALRKLTNLTAFHLLDFCIFIVGKSLTEKNLHRRFVL